MTKAIQEAVKSTKTMIRYAGPVSYTHLVYIVQEGENPEMAFDTADLDAHDGIFAVSREEWEQSLSLIHI